MNFLLKTPKIPRISIHLLRSYKVLAIETSCDDTCVAVLDRPDPRKPPQILYQSRESLQAVIADGGVIPTKAHTEHQIRLGPAVQKALSELGRPKIDYVCATRGPGMAGCLAVGYEFAKGLSVAWDVPLVPVHHMMGHLLVSRVRELKPLFPFVSLLVSGGHTMLVHSEDIDKHKILANTIDIAAGDALDKCAKHIGLKGQMLGRELERVSFGEDVSESNIEEKIELLESQGHLFPLDLPNPLKMTPRNEPVTKFSFALFISLLRQSDSKFYGGAIRDGDKQVLAYKIQKAVFGHILYRVKIALENHKVQATDFVCSGGVGSSHFLRYLLRKELPGFAKFHYPPPLLCTDNAVMIGWAGMELVDRGLVDPQALGQLCRPKWGIET